MKKREEIPVLFVSYDGVLDPLGQSQILPYVKGVANKEGGVIVLSFEKKNRLADGADLLRSDLLKDNIKWKYVRFTTGFGPAGKIWDMAKMYYWGFVLSLHYKVQVVHARGHLSAQVGLFLKRALSTRLIFDFRGLWADERVDKGSWDMSRVMHKMQYAHYKRKERKLLAAADHVVVLTKAVTQEVAKIGAVPLSKLTVIPCCADFEHFPLRTSQRTTKARIASNIPNDALVLGYLGSVGRIYMLDRFFRLYELAAGRKPGVHALVITQDSDALKEVMAEFLPPELHNRVHVLGASRNDVPDLIPAMDILISFYQPSYARMATSPTKIAECFASGIPVICSNGVGDVIEQVKALQGGVVVDPSSDEELLSLVYRLEEVRKMGGHRLRNAARKMLGLELAMAKYNAVYAKLRYTGVK